MCGIFGYLNYRYSKSRREISNILINGLKRLEYRGYDSAGIAIDGDSCLPNENLRIKIIKQRGRVKELESKIFDHENIDFDVKFDCHFGIAHTRWATHGEPSEKNSHPQSSGPENEFIVVHNGIISNYKDIQKYLKTRGYNQTSDTDTELIALLMKFFYDKHLDSDKRPTFVQLTNMVLELLEGAYALVLKSNYFPNEVIATKKSSPLIIGVKMNQHDCSFHVPIISHTTAFKPNCPHKSEVCVMPPEYCFDPNIGMEYFFASDASAIVEHTKRVIYLEEMDIAHVKEGFLKIYRHNTDDNVESVLLEEAKILHMELHEIMKGSFDTYMEKEIFEQPESLVNTMRGRVNFDTNEIKLGGLQSQITSIQRCRRIIFIGCGTSYHSCLAVRQIMEELTDLPIMIELASDLLDRSMPIFRDDVCVFVSQSGETADTLSALRYCRDYGSLLLGITNVVGSTICRETDCGINCNAGPEIGVASTKAYTSQIIALILFACLMGSDKISKASQIKEIISFLKELPHIVKECLKLSDQIKLLAKMYYETRSCLVVGRGNHSATCIEGALKVKEIAYIHSEGIQSGELKHGPLALVDEDMLIVIIITDCKIFSKCSNALQQILARKSNPLIVTDCLEKIGLMDSSHVLKIPHTIDCLQAVPAIIPFQLLSLHFAKLRGHDVDCPRNLAKSVTVE